METIVIHINIICGDIINSAVIQGGEKNTVDFRPAVGTNSTATNGKGALVPTQGANIGRAVTPGI